MLSLIRRILCFPFSLLRRSVQGQLWLLFVVFHAVWLLAGIANMSPPNQEFASNLEQLYEQGGWCSASLLAGRPFHYTYEAVLLKVVVFIDMPSMIVAIVPSMVVDVIARKVFGLSLYVSSYVDAVVLLLVASMQWCVMAYIVESRLCSGPKGQKVLSYLTQHKWPIITVLIVGGLALVLVLHYNSVALGGIRHGGMSFG